MSRIGNKLITLSAGVTVEVQENNYVVVKGPKGEIAKQLCPKMEIKVEGTTVSVVRPDDSIENKTLHGTTRANLNNMVEFIVSNLSTIVISAVVLLLVVLAIISMAKDKKKGKCSCGNSCSSCAMKGACHTNKK